MISFAAVLLSAAAYAACFPPLAWRPLAWVALVPLFAVAARSRPTTAAALGALWGTAATVAVAWWMAGAVREYFGVAPLIGWLGIAAIGAVYVGLPYGALAAWIAWATPGPLAIGLGWAGAELVRTYVLPDPWALLGTSQIDWPAMVQASDLAGVYAISGVIAAVNGVLAATIAPRLRRRPAELAAVAALPIALLLYGRHRLAKPPADVATFTVGVVQSGVGRGFRWEPAYREAGVTEHLDPSAKLHTEGVDLLVWPEHAVSFYPQEVTPPRERLFVGLGTLGDVVLGAPHYGRGPSGATVYHNAAFLIRHGRIAARYDKRRLVPVAETTGHTFYTPGVEPTLLPAEVARLGPLICLESMFPALARATVAAGAEVLVTLTNDSWLGAEAAARHHLEIARIRAIESHRWLVRAASTGYSAIVDPAGEVQKRSAFDRADALRGPVGVRRDLTVYDRSGDVPLALLAALAVAGSAATARRRR